MENKKLVLTAGKIWARIGLAILLLIGVYGVLAPLLFSNSESDFGVFLGMVVIWIAPFLAIWLIWPVLKFFFITKPKLKEMERYGRDRWR